MFLKSIIKPRHFSSTTLRNPAYKAVTDKNMSFFESILDSSSVITDPTLISPANHDWTKKYQGNSKLMLQPTSNQQVSEILKYCNQEKIAVVPQGSSTGLLDGSNPTYDEVILSMSSMNNILNFDESYGIITAQSGAMLEDLDIYLNEIRYQMPNDPNVKSSS
jgi:FAD/FMN-containing dehydrogenase